MSTYEIIEIVLLLLACYACYQAGVRKGIADTVELVLDNDLVTPEDFNKLLDKKLNELD